MKTAVNHFDNKSFSSVQNNFFGTIKYILTNNENVITKNTKYDI